MWKPFDYTCSALCIIVTGVLTCWGGDRNFFLAPYLLSVQLCQSVCIYVIWLLGQPLEANSTDCHVRLYCHVLQSHQVMSENDTGHEQKWCRSGAKIQVMSKNGAGHEQRYRSWTTILQVMPSLEESMRSRRQFCCLFNQTVNIYILSYSYSKVSHYSLPSQEWSHSGSPQGTTHCLPQTELSLAQSRVTIVNIT